MKKMLEKKYRFSVGMEGRQEIEVVATDAAGAGMLAAKKWGVSWKLSAKDMVIRQISKKAVTEP